MQVGEGSQERNPIGSIAPIRIIRNAQQRMLPTRPQRPDAALLPSADVDQRQEPDGGAGRPAPRIAAGQRMTIRWLPAAPATECPPLTDDEKSSLLFEAVPREVPTHSLEAECAGRVFPCLQGNRYTGCIGFSQCKVRCWAQRPDEREAVVRVERAVGSACRGCFHAREVLGDYALVDGRKVALMECRLGFWHGRAAFEDFLDDKIALKVRLPCPGFVASDGSSPALEENCEDEEDRQEEEEAERDWLEVEQDEDWLEDDWTV